jgi:hypothetical protein
MTRKTMILVSSNRAPTVPETDIVVTGRGDDDCLDLAFINRTFCLVGLPLRRQFERDKKTRKAVEPQREVSAFSRVDDRYSFTVNSRTVVLPSEIHPNGLHVPIGIPFGAKARLIILWMTTQSRLTGSRWLELGRISDWLESVGIAPHPESYVAAREQLIRLAFCHFTMVYADREKRQDLFRDCSLIDSKIFAQDDIANYGAGELKKLRYPVGIQLTTQAFEQFTGPDVIPICTEALRKINNNAVAIDVYLYLHFLLPSIPRGEKVLLSWKKLARQFGNVGETAARFRQMFHVSVEQALHAYRDADFNITDEGYELRYSPPAEPQKTLVAVSSDPTRTVLKTHHRVRNRIQPPPGIVSAAEGDKED